MKNKKKTGILVAVLSTSFIINTYAGEFVFVSPVIENLEIIYTGPVIPWAYYENATHPMLFSSISSKEIEKPYYHFISNRSNITVNNIPVMESIEFEEKTKVVELLPWSYVSNILTRYMPIQVYDVLTGLVYYVYSFSNGNHADVRTVSAEDTAIMFHTFGYQWSWSVRPVWVTIGDRVVAASINGQPHGALGNPNNGLGGHVCLHFFGSTVHNGNLNFARLHQDVLHRAYAMFKENI